MLAASYANSNERQWRCRQNNISDWVAQKPAAHWKTHCSDFRKSRKHNNSGSQIDFKLRIFRENAEIIKVAIIDPDQTNPTDRIDQHGQVAGVEVDKSEAKRGTIWTLTAVAACFVCYC